MPVTDSIEVVRRFTDGLRAGDIRACLDLLEEGGVFSEGPGLPFGGDYIGADGFRRMLRAVNSDFLVDLEPPRITGTGSCVAVLVAGTFTSRKTGRSMPIDCVDVYRVREGKIARVDVYYKDPQALSELCREHDAAPTTGRPHSDNSEDRGEFE